MRRSSPTSASVATRSALRFAVASSLLFSCTGANDSPDAGGPNVFIAYESSFAGFHSWSSAPATAPDDASDGLHGVGPLRVYLNEAPPHRAKSFPVGTIIVKETEEADVTQRTVFAMVKRGGGFNSADGGALDWEWFSLRNNSDGTVTQLWRNAPQSSDSYAGQPIGDCNGCHFAARENDYVWDTALELSRF
jgi:hypothetical protein